MSCPLCQSPHHEPPGDAYTVTPEVYAAFCVERGVVERAEAKRARYHAHAVEVLNRAADAWMSRVRGDGI